MSQEEQAVVNDCLEELEERGKSQTPRPLDNPEIFGNFNVAYTSTQRAPRQDGQRKSLLTACNRNTLPACQMREQENAPQIPWPYRQLWRQFVRLQRADASAGFVQLILAAMLYTISSKAGAWLAFWTFCGRLAFVISLTDGDGEDMWSYTWM